MKIPDTLATTATTTATTNIQSNESVHSRAVAPGVINIATTNSTPTACNETTITKASTLSSR